MLKGDQERIHRRDLEGWGVGATDYVGVINVAALKKGVASNVALGTVHNAPLASAPGREYPPPLILGMLGDHEGQVKIYIYISWMTSNNNIIFRCFLLTEFCIVYLH